MGVAGGSSARNGATGHVMRGQSSCSTCSAAVRVLGSILSMRQSVIYF